MQKNIFCSVLYSDVKSDNLMFKTSSTKVFLYRPKWQIYKKKNSQLHLNRHLESSIFPFSTSFI